MSAQRPPSRSPAEGGAQTFAAIERLRMPPLIANQSIAGYRIIMALRLLTVCSCSGHDPLPILAQRLASVTAAKAIIAFADEVGRSWPENVQVMRPCCAAITHDELTVALLIDAAAAGRRDICSMVVEGLVRPGRHEPLYELAKGAVAQLL